jgi:hypothetical protein
LAHDGFPSSRERQRCSQDRQVAQSLIEAGGRALCKSDGHDAISGYVGCPATEVTRGYKKLPHAQLTGAANSDILNPRIRKDVSYRSNTNQRF